MELTWLGRYRELVRALVFYSNSSNRGINSNTRGKDEYGLNQNEYQVLEYICEFEDENRIMAAISRDTGILQSNVTKATKRLVSLGLVERFHPAGNRKSIVLKPTPLGKTVYRKYAADVEAVFRPFFELLSQATNRELVLFEQAVRLLGGSWSSMSENSSTELEKIEE